jgi:hypothetical protein
MDQANPQYVMVDHFPPTPSRRADPLHPPAGEVSPPSTSDQLLDRDEIAGLQAMAQALKEATDGLAQFFDMIDE